MQFGPNQLRRFKSTDGAYSSVTDNEYENSQITLTDHEKKIVLDYFGEHSIVRGSIDNNPNLASKEFFLYPNGNPIRLNVNFPKSVGTELRLYLNKDAFKPEPNSVGFLFLRENRLWIGAMREQTWRSGSADVISDDADSTYQNLIRESDESKIATLKGRDIYVRDRKIALESMENTGYVCEFNNTHALFNSRRTGKPYVEAHHLIPMEFQPEFQKNFKISLDVVSNVFCLCPHCHRAVHLAQQETTKEILETLTSNRNVLPQFNISQTDLYALYGVEDIV